MANSTTGIFTGESDCGCIQFWKLSNVPASFNSQFNSYGVVIVARDELKVGQVFDGFSNLLDSEKSNSRADYVLGVVKSTVDSICNN